LKKGGRFRRGEKRRGEEGDLVTILGEKGKGVHYYETAKKIGKNDSKKRASREKKAVQFSLSEKSCDYVRIGSWGERRKNTLAARVERKRRWSRIEKKAVLYEIIAGADSGEGGKR